MKFDVYASITQKVQEDDNTHTEKSTTSRYRNMATDEAKSKVQELFENIPENATGFYLEVYKSYEERMDDALAREVGY